MILVKRVYAKPGRADGARFLVDYLWPRGVTKQVAELKGWLRDVAPSPELRKWFSHDPAKWEAFQTRYFAELDCNPEAWLGLLRAAETGPVTLVYAAEDTEHNNAVALKNYLERQQERAAKRERAHA